MDLRVRGEQPCMRALLCQLASLSHGMSGLQVNNTTGVLLSNRDRDHALEIVYATENDGDLEPLRKVSKELKSAVDKVRRKMKVYLKDNWLFSHLRDFEVDEEQEDRITAEKIETVLQELEGFSSRRNITSIVLNHLPMSEAASVGRFVGVLRKCPALAELCLFSSRMGDAGVRTISQDVMLSDFCTALSSLRLGRNEITMTGFSALAHGLHRCVNLTHLDLSNNMINVSLMGYIFTKCPLLNHLDLQNNEIVAMSVRILEMSIRDLTHLSLAVLVLNENEIGNEGFGYLMPVLRKCTNLTHLSISNTHLTEQIISSGTLDDCLTTLHHLDIGRNDIGDSLHRVLPACTALTHLDHKCTDSNDLTLLAPALQQCTALLYLDLSANNLEWNIRQFVENPVTTLTHLNLSSNGLDSVYLDEDLSDDDEMFGQYEIFMTNWQTWIQACPSLVYLDLSDNYLEWPAAQLNNCPSITHLDLGNSLYTAPMIRELQLTNLTHLNLFANDRLHEFDSPYLTNLRILKLNYCQFEPTDKFVSTMRNCSALTHLDLESNRMQAKDLLLIVEVIKGCTQLTHLDLSRNKFGDIGMERISFIFTMYHALKFLNLSYNGVSMQQRKKMKYFQQQHCKELVLIQMGPEDLEEKIGVFSTVQDGGDDVEMYAEEDMNEVQGGDDDAEEM